MNGVADDSPLRPAEAQPSEMMGYPAVIGLDSSLITSMTSSHRIRSNPLSSNLYFHWMTCCACSGAPARVMRFLPFHIYFSGELHSILFSTFLSLQFPAVYLSSRLLFHPPHPQADPTTADIL